MADVVEHKIGFVIFQAACDKEVFAVFKFTTSNVAIQPAFNQAEDFTLHRDCDVVPTEMTACSVVRAVCKLHIKDFVRLQAVFGGNGVVGGFAFHQRE